VVRTKHSADSSPSGPPLPQGGRVKRELAARLLHVAAPLDVIGDPSKFRSALQGRMKRADDLTAEIEAARRNMAAVGAERRGRFPIAAELEALEALEAVEGLGSRIHTWSGTNRKLVQRFLAEDAANRYEVAVAPRLPWRLSIGGLDDAQTYLTVRRGELASLLRRLPKARDLPRPAGELRLAVLRGSGLFDVEVLDDFESRLGRAASRSSWRDVILAAKELVEATHWATFDALDVPRPPRSTDFPALGKHARRAILDAERRRASEAVQIDSEVRLDKGFATVVNELANLRNSHGRGHGRTRVIPGLAQRHVDLAVDSATTYCRFIVGTLSELGALPP